MENMRIVGYGVAEGIWSASRSLQQALNYGNAKEEISAASSIYVGVLGKVSMSDYMGITDAISDIAPEDADITSSCNEGAEEDDGALIVLAVMES